MMKLRRLYSRMEGCCGVNVLVLENEISLGGLAVPAREPCDYFQKAGN